MCKQAGLGPEKSSGRIGYVEPATCKGYSCETQTKTFITYESLPIENVEFCIVPNTFGGTRTRVSSLQGPNSSAVEAGDQNILYCLYFYEVIGVIHLIY
jgi:hypothetical protein